MHANTRKRLYIHIVCVGFSFRRTHRTYSRSVRFDTYRRPVFWNMWQFWILGVLYEPRRFRVTEIIRSSRLGLVMFRPTFAVTTYFLSHKKHQYRSKINTHDCLYAYNGYAVMAVWFSLFVSFANKERKIINRRFLRIVIVELVFLFTRFKGNRNDERVCRRNWIFSNSLAKNSRITRFLHYTINDIRTDIFRYNLYSAVSSTEPNPLKLYTIRMQTRSVIAWNPLGRYKTAIVIGISDTLELILSARQPIARLQHGWKVSGREWLFFGKNADASDFSIPFFQYYNILYNVFNVDKIVISTPNLG